MSGQIFAVAPFIPATHAALRAFTGKAVMSAFQKLSAGKIGHAGAPGTGVPACAESMVVSDVSRTPTTTTPRRTRRITTVLSAHLDPVLTILEEHHPWRWPYAWR